MSKYPELAKVGYGLLGFAILLGAIWLRWQCVKADEVQPITKVSAPAPSPAPPDMELYIDPTVLQEAMEHMQRSVKRWATEEERIERKKKKKSSRPAWLPKEMQYLGTD
jgi:hypothetical protein